MITLNSNEIPCPCGSNKLVYNCCLQSHGLLPARLVAQPPFPRTNHSNPRCYASEVNDCCEEMSREHYVSKTILRQVNWQKTLFVGGLGKNIGPKVMAPDGAMNAKVLCKRHNEALTNLDRLAGRLYAALTFHDPSVQLDSPKYSLFNGHDVERLMIKMLCGSYASDSGWKPPVQILEILFGYSDLPAEYGLHINPSIGQATFGARGVSLTPVVDVSGNIIGGGFIEVSGCQFFLKLHRNAMWETPITDYEYRPNGLQLIEEENSKFVLFGWNKNVNNKIWVVVYFRLLC